MTKTIDRIQVDGAGNAYVAAPEGLEFVGWWNPSLRQFTFDTGEVWDVSPDTSVEAFLASFTTNEEVAEAESLTERDELIDRGCFGSVEACELCEGPRDGTHPTLCVPCANYEQWHAEHFGERS